MASSTTKIIAVIAVIAIVAAGAAVMLTGGSDDKETTYDIDGALPVLGNADKDYDIDKKDLDIITKVINNESGYTLSAYPFADANNDGVVDDKDKEIVQKIINKEKVRTYVINTNFDESTYVDYLDWPQTAGISAGYSALPMLYKVAGVMNYIKGITLSAPYGVDAILYPEFVGMKSLGPDMRQFDLESVKQCKDETGASVIICKAGLNNEKQMKEMGMSIVKPDCTSNSVEGFTSALLLMGFIFDTPTQSLEVSEWYNELRQELDAKLDTAKKTTCITLSGSGAWGPTSNYGTLCLYAGGDHPSIMKENPNGSWKYGDWVYQMDDCDYIIEFESASEDNSWFDENNDEKKYIGGFEKYKDTKMYLNGNIAIIAYDVPMPLKVMYTSIALHPDLFTEDWGDEKSQEFFDKFFDGKYDASKLNFLLDGKEIKALFGE